MKVKVSDLNVVAINFLVSQLQGNNFEMVDGELITGQQIYENDPSNEFYGCEFDEIYAPCADASIVDPLIDEYFIDQMYDRELGQWNAVATVDRPEGWAYGVDKHRKAAVLKCYINIMKGEEVDLPDGFFEVEVEAT